MNVDSKKKAGIIQRVEALFPYLQGIIGQNDMRSNQIVDRLIALRDNLDQIFENIED